MSTFNEHSILALIKEGLHGSADAEAEAQGIPPSQYLEHRFKLIQGLESIADFEIVSSTDDEITYAGYLENMHVSPTASEDCRHVIIKTLKTPLPLDGKHPLFRQLLQNYFFSSMLPHYKQELLGVAMTNDQLYLVMERLEGRLLSDILLSDSVNEATKTNLVCRSLAQVALLYGTIYVYVHSGHEDIYLPNLFITNDDRVVFLETSKDVVDDGTLTPMAIYLSLVDNIHDAGFTWNQSLSELRACLEKEKDNEKFLGCVYWFQVANKFHRIAYPASCSSIMTPVRRHVLKTLILGVSDKTGQRYFECIDKAITAFDTVEDILPEHFNTVLPDVFSDYSVDGPTRDTDKDVTTMNCTRCCSILAEALAESMKAETDVFHVRLILMMCPQPFTLLSQGLTVSRKLDLSPATLGIVIEASCQQGILTPSESLGMVFELCEADAAGLIDIMESRIGTIQFLGDYKEKLAPEWHQFIFTCSMQIHMQRRLASMMGLSVVGGQ